MGLNQDAQVPVARPKKEVYLKLSVPSKVIDESYIATLFELKEVHTETYQGKERIVASFNYLDPLVFPDLMHAFGIKAGEDTANAQVPVFLQLYGETSKIGSLGRIITGALDTRGSGDVKEGLSGLGMYLPKSGDYTEEHLQLKLEWATFDGNFVRICFTNYAVIQREEDLSAYVEDIVKGEDIKGVYSSLSELVPKILGHTKDMPNPMLVANSPEEMVEKMLGVERLGGGYVKVGRSGEPKVILTLNETGARELIEVIMGL